MHRWADEQESFRQDRGDSTSLANGQLLETRILDNMKRRCSLRDPRGKCIHTLSCACFESEKVQCQA